MRHYLQTIHAWGQIQWVQILAYATWATLIVVLTAAVLLYLGSSNDVFVLALSLATLAPAYFLLQQLRSAPEHG